MHGISLLALLLLGCSGDRLYVAPTVMEWGEVDFQQEQPPEGYSAQTLLIRNERAGSVEVLIEDFDDRLVLDAPNLTSGDPPRLPPLRSGASHVLTVGVGGYEPGERDTLVSGEFTVITENRRHAAGVRWSFIPIRNIPVDTGDLR
ncbi:MAG: hypothetical protein JRI25_11555 [Deltaproteobacteria bacterium]|nr:hypothetical protein [Deltaproteobacteria bacterium]